MSRPIPRARYEPSVSEAAGAAGCPRPSARCVGPDGRRLFAGVAVLGAGAPRSTPPAPAQRAELFNRTSCEIRPRGCILRGPSCELGDHSAYPALQISCCLLHGAELVNDSLLTVLFFVIVGVLHGPNVTRTTRKKSSFQRDTRSELPQRNRLYYLVCSDSGIPIATGMPRPDSERNGTRRSHSALREGGSRTFLVSARLYENQEFRGTVRVAPRKACARRSASGQEPMCRAPSHERRRGRVRAARAPHDDAALCARSPAAPLLAGGGSLFEEEGQRERGC